MRGYDQWKTASPYDDEPDVIQEMRDTVDAFDIACRNWGSELPDGWKYLCRKMRDTLADAADYFEENG